MSPIVPANVAQVLASYPLPIQVQILAVRALIFATAAATEGVGVLEETLKWGEPAYLTTQSRSGSTLRLAWKPTQPEQYGLYFNCQTTLVATFRTLFPDTLKFAGNRAIVFAASESPPQETLAYCIAAALTYHRQRVDR